MTPSRIISIFRAPPPWGAVILAIMVPSAVRFCPEAPTVNGWATDVPPPGVGLKTVTCAVPAAAVSAANITAFSWVALTNVVARSFPFQRTTEPVTKLEPFTVIVRSGPPVAALAGVNDVKAGAGLLPAGTLTTKVCMAEVPPPGPGVTTVTCALPAAAMSLAGIAAVNCVALPNVVVRFVPFHCTLEELKKFEPVTVRVKAPPPALALAGAIEDRVGTGFCGACALIVNASAREVPPPGAGVTTLTCALPAAAMSLAVIAAVNCVALTNVVGRFAPFHCTVEEFTKFEPVTDNENPAPPALVFVGAIAAMDGAGLLDPAPS